MKILIISSYFGPETSVGVLRVNAFANHWSRQGHDVHVLTMPFTGELPAGLRDNPRIHVQQIAPWLIRGGQAGGVQGYSKGVKGWRRALLSFQYWLKRRLLSNYLDPRVLWWPRAALVGQGRLAVFYAAVASLAMLFQQAMQWVTLGSDAGGFVHVGSISIGFFATAIAVRLLARRVIANESLARERGRDLAEQVRVNERVIRDMDDGVLVVDTLGHVRQANPQARRLLDPLMPRPVMLADYSPALAAAMAAQADPERERVFVLDLPSRPAALRVRCVPAGGAGGHLVFIEDLARLREQARQIKLAALGRLTASMAHEIRNPLAAISQAAELLQEVRRVETQARLTRIIGDNAQRLDRMVSDVLELGRRDRAEPELLELGSYVRTFVDEFAMREPGVRARVHIETGAPARIWFDRGHLHQVLWNLLGNALRFAGPDDGAVRLTVSATEDATLLDIVDNGPGVSDSARAHLFEPFFTTHSRGTGLGLYIARELSDANGAALDFVDNSPGAHFRLRGLNRSLDESWNGGGLSGS